MTAPKVKDPVVNAAVYTLDGEQFGTVKEVHGGYFKLDVPMAPDYWLSSSYIGDAMLDRVTLTLRKDEMEEHRLSAPGLETQESSSGVIDDQAMLSQRERMERELSAQNERLRAGQV